VVLDGRCVEPRDSIAKVIDFAKSKQAKALAVGGI
jgi:hypothetical protein